MEKADEKSVEMRKFLAETKQLNFQKIEFDKIREILKKGIEAFNHLKEEWSQLVKFFQMTSNIIEVCLNNSVKKLAQTLEVSSKSSLGG